MARIQRRISFVKNLQTELDARLQITNLVGDATAPDGSAAFDVTSLSANAVKTATDLLVPKADIVDNLTTADATKVLSANQGKELKDLIDGMANGLSFMGSFDIGTEGALPAAPATGDFYKIINSVDAAASVTLGGLHLTQGDSIYYASSSWIKIDSTESADILRDADVSTDADFTVDPTLLTDRATIKSLVDAAAAAVTPKVINETVTLTGDTATLTHAPANDTIFMGYVQVNNGDDTWDLVQASASGTTLTISPTTPGEYTGLQAVVSYMYF